MNLAQNLERAAFFFPGRPAIRQADLELTYAELNDRANRIATGLISLGIKPGDHVGLCSLNSADWVAFYFGVIKAGAVAVTLSGLLTGDELKLLVSHSKPRMMFTSEQKLGEVERLKDQTGLEKIICPGGDIDLAHLMSLGSGTFEAIDRDRADIGAILFTGGTTGIPKGAMLTHEGMNFSSWSIATMNTLPSMTSAFAFFPSITCSVRCTF